MIWPSSLCSIYFEPPGSGASIGGKKKDDFRKRCTIPYTMITVNNPRNRTLNNVVIVDLIFIYCFCARITQLNIANKWKFRTT